MKAISQFWEEVGIIAEESPAHKWNEAELRKAVIRYKVNGIVAEKSVLLRECINGDKDRHNAEIREIYDRLRAINAAYEESGKKYRVNVVKHFTDEEGNIYVKDLNPGGDVFVYDLMPDGYYLDDDKKPKSRFSEFKKNVAEFRLNSPQIISNMFEQLAVLHANGFFVGKLVRGDLEVIHPTLSLFLYRLKNKKSETDPKIYVHDIHNLELSAVPNSERVQRCVRDLRDLSFDIIRYFKGVGLPYMGFKKYGDVLRELAPEFYGDMYSAFLWDPHIEIETLAMTQLASEVKRERSESRQVIERMGKNLDKAPSEPKKLFRIDGVFMLGARREKIREFVESANPENTEFVFDFDGTLTAPWSSNALHEGVMEDWTYGLSDEPGEGFVFRRWALAFLRLVMASGFETKIHSLGFKEVILAALKANGVDFPEDKVFANGFERPVSTKAEVPVGLNPKKKQVVIGDNPVDFDVECPNGSLKIGFLASGRETGMFAATDFAYLPVAGDYFHLYHLFRKYFELKK